MNIIGQAVRHKTLGEGIVKEQDDEYIIVHYQDGDKKFPYPESFNVFFIALDEKVDAKIRTELAAIQQEKETKLRAQQETEALAKVTAEKRPNTVPRPKSSQFRTAERESGRRLTFYVFQGKTFDKASREGYIWAPIKNKDGDEFHHWHRLLDVMKGDVIFHGCDGEIVAISVARDRCYNADNPDTIITGDTWDNNGRRVDCDYIVLANPVKTALFRPDIIELSTEKYSAFNRLGDGNLGYLYRLDPRLAAIFTKCLLQGNPVLDDMDFVQDILSYCN